jgi:hypothetical protein
MHVPGTVDCRPRASSPSKQSRPSAAFARLHCSLAHPLTRHLCAALAMTAFLHARNLRACRQKLRSPIRSIHGRRNPIVAQWLGVCQRDCAAPLTTHQHSALSTTTRRCYSLQRFVCVASHLFLPDGPGHARANMTKGAALCCPGVRANSR